MSFNVSVKYNEFQIPNNNSSPTDLINLNAIPSVDKVYTINYTILREYTNGLSFPYADMAWVDYFSSSSSTAYTTAIVGRTLDFQSSGKWIVGGGVQTLVSPNSITSSLTRLFPDGSVDTSFPNTAIGTTASALGIAVQSDDKIIVYGVLNTLNYNGVVFPGILRLNSDGSLDTTFNTNIGTGFTTGSPRTAIVQADGKIVLGGQFTGYKGNTRNRLIRLNSDGTEDTTFSTNLGTGFGTGTFGIACICQQLDGKLLVSGQFTTFNGATRGNVVRLNTNGTEDSTFATNTGTGGNSIVYNALVDTSQNVFLSGIFTTWNGVSRGNLVKLSSAGVVDSTFATNAGTGFSGALTRGQSMKISSTGDIYLACSLTSSFNGVTQGSVMKISNAGIADTAWRASLKPFNTSFSGTTSTLYLTPGETDLILIGQHSGYNGAAVHGFIKICLTTRDYKLQSEGQLIAIYDDVNSQWSLTTVPNSGMSGFEPFSGSGIRCCGVTFTITPGGIIRYTSTNVPVGVKVNSYLRYRIDML